MSFICDFYQVHYDKPELVTCKETATRFFLYDRFLEVRCKLHYPASNEYITKTEISLEEAITADVITS